MAPVGRITTPSSDDGTPQPRRDLRKHVPWSGVLQTARGPFQCRVVDISPGGVKLSLAAEIPIGQPVTLIVAGLGAFRGEIVWQNDGMMGVKFAEEASRG